ncbi:hypothetical protein ACFUCQ_22105 [Streptomyces sp. NPDC057197]|uniref:hypothetical protein n=1 Tax=Streptomyces sp. NPDC057197 TaxID=3346045 RepID=UPI003639F575
MRKNTRRALTATTSLAAGAGVSLGLFLGTGSAHAADLSEPAPKAPAATDLAQAAHAADTAQAREMAGRFFVHLDQRARHLPVDQAARADITAQAAAKSPEAAGDAVPVYSLSADFVTGKAGSAPAQVAYLAVKSVSADGRQATARVEPQQHGYAVVGMAQGTDEIGYAAKAKGGYAFTEPQLNAWYRVSGQQVLPLNESARQSVGEHGTTLTAYQHLVHQRYADKLPGSAYQKSHKYGGVTPATGTVSLADTTPRALLAGGGGAVAAGAGALLITLVTRRRDTTA